jgi:chromosome segregation ATPase
MKLDTANQSDQDVCPLCGKEPSTSREQIIPQEEMLRHDLNSRIEELDESIQRHTESLKKQKLIVSELQEKKALLDEQLKEELKNYDSTFLASSREVERRCATLQERLRGLERILRIPNAIARLEEKADKLASEEAHLEREIQEEKAELTSAGQYIQEIEDSFLQSLI